jgi:hypothetical protein
VAIGGLGKSDAHLLQQVGRTVSAYEWKLCQYVSQ